MKAVLLAWGWWEQKPQPSACRISQHIVTMDTLDGIILCYGGSPLHCRTFSSILGVYTLEAGSISSQLRQPKVSPDSAKCSLGGDGGGNNPG